MDNITLGFLDSKVAKQENTSWVCNPQTRDFLFTVSVSEVSIIIVVLVVVLHTLGWLA